MFAFATSWIPIFPKEARLSKKFSIAVLLLVFAAGLTIVGQTSQALQAAPAAQEHGAMGGPSMGAMTQRAA